MTVSRVVPDIQKHVFSWTTNPHDFALNLNGQYGDTQYRAEDRGLVISVLREIADMLEQLEPVEE